MARPQGARHRPDRRWTARRPGPQPRPDRRAGRLEGRLHRPCKQHLVLYLTGGLEERYGALLGRLGQHRAGKGCLYLKRLDDVDESVLRQLIVRTVRVHRGIDRASRR
ncbi:DUF1801 domain-containing protein [Micromonospora sp. NPDC050276]|uniref:DUF1801 domain-containing protein n=1 Tax=Micromonospora sp. NPDC050276 TaxID=3364278 RepID=UPI0037A52D22